VLVREKGITVNILKTRSVAVAALVALSSGSAVHGQSAGGSFRLTAGDESVTWVTGVDGSTEWTERGYEFSGSGFGDGWGVNWEMLANTASAQYVVANFSVINTSSEAQTFHLFVTDTVAMDYRFGAVVGGSIAGTFTDLDGNGVTTSTVGEGSIYTAFVDATAIDPFDGTVVGNLLEGAMGTAGIFQSGTFGESAFGDYPILPGAQIAGADLNYGFIIEFTLSAGDTAGFTASMAIATPAPGVLAILSVGGLIRSRRRSG
jgi:hypothetical protein